MLTPVALIVIPLVCSSSLVSHVRSSPILSGFINLPIPRKASERVDFPASTCAVIMKFRVLFILKIVLSLKRFYKKTGLLSSDTKYSYNIIYSSK